MNTTEPTPARRRRRPRLQRGGRPGAAASAACTPTSTRTLPVHASGSRSPTTPAPTRTLGDRQRPGRRAAAASRAVHLDAEGPRPGAARRLVRQRRRRCSPTWTSTCPPTSTRCCRWSRRCSPATPTWPSAPGSRRGSRVVRGAEARVHLALLQPAPAHGRCGAGFSDAQCGFKAIRADVARAAAARWSRTPAGSSTPSCSCSPSAPGCASTRCRSTGSTTPTPASTSSRPPLADLKGVWRLRCRLTRAGRSPAARRPAAPCAAVAAASGRSRASRRSASSARSRTPCSTCCSGQPCRRQPPTRSRLLLTAVGNTAANRRLTFGVRGTHGAGCGTSAGPRRLRRRPRAHVGRSSRSWPPRPGAEPRSSSSPCSSSPTCSPPSCASSSSAPGSSAARRRSPPPRIADPIPEKDRPMTTLAAARSPTRRSPRDDARAAGRPASSDASSAADRRGPPPGSVPAFARRARPRRRCSTSWDLAAQRLRQLVLLGGGAGRPRRAGRRCFFGSLDAGNFITVDKPPLAIWVMGLSVRLFGLNSWSILVPAGADGRRHRRPASSRPCADRSARSRR